jgi:Erv1 / Alr family
MYVLLPFSIIVVIWLWFIVIMIVSVAHQIEHPAPPVSSCCILLLLCPSCVLLPVCSSVSSSCILLRISHPTPSPPRDNTVSREQLGGHVWPYLHTAAAHYPEDPSSKDQEDMETFLALLAKFYPCKMCSLHFSELLRAHPPDVSSRDGLSRWLCEAHNIVNHRLNKPQFPCGYVDQAWPSNLAGECGCEDDTVGFQKEAVIAAASTKAIRSKSEST